MTSISHLDKKIFAWSFEHNLGLIVQYHNFVRAKLHQQLLSEPDDAFQRETIHRYDRINATNCFLMAYAHLEEQLYGIWHALSPSVTLGKTSSVDRFKPALQAAGVDLGRSAAWTFIQGASALRDCLLHANGNISLSRDKPKLHRFIAKNPDVVDRGRIRITPDYLKRFVVMIGDLRNEAVRE